jgi:hypothetical protein
MSFDELQEQRLDLRPENIVWRYHVHVAAYLVSTRGVHRQQRIHELPWILFWKGWFLPRRGFVPVEVRVDAFFVQARANAMCSDVHQAAFRGG